MEKTKKIVNIEGMACEHTQPADVVKMAESLLKERNIDPARWEGFHLRFRENVDLWGHKSICIEVLRRNNEWVVTRLDRLPDRAPEAELGTLVLKDV